MTTYDTLHQSFIKCRREHGAERATALVTKYGGRDGDLESVPEARWDELIAAFESGATKPKTLDEIAPRAWARWNNPPKRTP